MLKFLRMGKKRDGEALMFKPEHLLTMLVGNSASMTNGVFDGWYKQNMTNLSKVCYCLLEGLLKRQGTTSHEHANYTSIGRVARYFPAECHLCLPMSVCRVIVTERTKEMKGEG